MKKILFAALFFAMAQQALAQTDTLKKTTTRTSSRPVTLVNPNQQLLKKQNAQAPLPDMRITAITVTYKGEQTFGGEVKQVYEINYTVKNEGTLAIRAGSVSVQGYFSNDPNYPLAVPGCGSGVALPPNQMLNPGESGSGFINCTIKFTKSAQTLYTLLIDPGNYVKELDESNNKAQVSIL